MNQGHNPRLVEKFKMFKVHICLVAKRALMNTTLILERLREQMERQESILVENVRFSSQDANPVSAGKRGTRVREYDLLLYAARDVGRVLVLLDPAVPLPPENIFKSLAQLAPLGVSDSAVRHLRKVLEDGTNPGPFRDWLNTRVIKSKSISEASAIQFWVKEWIRYANEYVNQGIG